MAMGNSRAIALCAITFFALLVVDVISTVMNSGIYKYLESNPLYSRFGIIGIIVVNLLILGFFVWWYRKSKEPMSAFVIIHSLNTVNLVRLFVIINNFRVFRNPPTIEVAMQVTTQMKQAAVAQVVLPQVIPFILAGITFWMLAFDYKMEKKE